MRGQHGHQPLRQALLAGRAAPDGFLHWLTTLEELQDVTGVASALAVEVDSCVVALPPASQVKWGSVSRWPAWRFVSGRDKGPRREIGDITK
ncbi:hypothetical protein D7Y04_02520 [Corallococcus sp. AB038B]|nr:hypothetical protein D7Y04_02520 [Corallococcus sp. AB038B]